MGSHPQLANMEDYFRERLSTPWSLRACRTVIEKFRVFIYQRSLIDGNDENHLSATVMGKYRSLGLPTTQVPPVSRMKPLVMAAGRMAT